MGRAAAVSRASARSPLRTWLDRLPLLEALAADGAPVIVACSGGADSLALLALAAAAGSRSRPTSITGCGPGRTPTSRSSRRGGGRLGVPADCASPSRPGPNLEALARRATRHSTRRGSAAGAPRSSWSVTRPTTRPRPCSSTCSGARRPPGSRPCPRARARSCVRCSVCAAATRRDLRASGVRARRRPDERRRGSGGCGFAAR